MNKSYTMQPGEASLPQSLMTTGPLTDRQQWLRMATEDVDRAGDVILLSGMDAENFVRNPQFLWQHGKSGTPFNTIGSVKLLLVVGNALYAKVEYATADQNPAAEQAWQLASAGLLPANSIGFRPIEWVANDTGGNTFLKWELIECSKVELPMNPAAVQMYAPEAALSLANACGTEDVSVPNAVDWLAQTMGMS